MLATENVNCDRSVDRKWRARYGKRRLGSVEAVRHILRQ